MFLFIYNPYRIAGTLVIGCFALNDLEFRILSEVCAEIDPNLLTGDYFSKCMESRYIAIGLIRVSSASIMRLLNLSSLKSLSGIVILYQLLEEAVEYWAILIGDESLSSRVLSLMKKGSILLVDILKTRLL